MFVDSCPCDVLRPRLLPQSGLQLRVASDRFDVCFYIEWFCVFTCVFILYIYGLDLKSEI